MSNFFQVSELLHEHEESRKLYVEFLRIPPMSAGIYVLPAGGTDPQRPHSEDEVYYVVRGRARMQVGNEDQAVSAGTVIFVAQGVEHRFHNVMEELVVLVFFAPAESP